MVFDAGAHGETHYFAMELVEGESLDKRLETETKLDEERALRIASTIAGALEYSREQGLIHRDIKPANMLIDRRGTVKLADMGLARLVASESSKLTTAGSMVGTPLYIAPEQARGEDRIDCRADVYSLGASLFHLLTGQPPFEGRSAADIVSKHLNDDPPMAGDLDPAVSFGASLVVNKAMEKEPERRYQTPGEMAGDIKAVLAGRDPPLAAELYGVRTASRALRPIGVAVAAATALAVAAGLLSRGTRPAGQEEAAPPALHASRAPSHEVTGPTPARPATAPDEGRPDADSTSAERETPAGAGHTVPSEEAIASVVEELELPELVAELERKEDFKRELDAAQAFAADGDHAGAAAALRRALKHATEARRADIEARAAAMDARSAHDAAMARAREHDEAVADARDALEKKDWPGALDRARHAQGLKPGDHVVEEIIASAERGARREKEREEQRVKAAVRAVEEARDAADWGRVVALGKKALARQEGNASVRAALEEAEWALSLPGAVSASLGMEFVLVPGGWFRMGADDAEEDERPAHRVRLDAYYIGRCEVSNAQYERYDPSHRVRRTRYSPGDDTPVVAVSWEEATAFCRWLSLKEDVEYRLPTEAEWERAARGTKGSVFPWGDRKPAPDQHLLNASWGASRRDWQLDGARHAASVAAFPDGASTCGALNMAGNVWEWCADWYARNEYERSPRRNPTGPERGGYRVLRGGSFANSSRHARSTNRTGAKPDLREATVGFRCVRVARRPEPEERGGEP
jgi:formylglycine-generating enzyme required for sulfatase activity